MEIPQVLPKLANPAGYKSSHPEELVAAACSLPPPPLVVLVFWPRAEHRASSRQLELQVGGSQRAGAPQRRRREFCFGHLSRCATRPGKPLKRAPSSPLAGLQHGGGGRVLCSGDPLAAGRTFLSATWKELTCPSGHSASFGLASWCPHAASSGWLVSVSKEELAEAQPSR